MAKPAPVGLLKADMQSYAENWQRCRTEDIPGLFQGYDADQKQSERLVTFRLSADDLKDFRKTIKPSSDKLRFVVHLGLLHDEFPHRIPKDPAFCLFIQAYYSASDYQKQCFPLLWEPNGKFAGTSTNSSAEAIPAAAAYLFVHSWMETFSEDLALPFESVSHDLDRRVQAYVFSNNESKAIASDLGTDKKSADGLDIHLGRGLAVAGHPFSFRPVIEIRNPVRSKKSLKILAKATGILDDDGDSYYDFGGPIPPPIP